MATFQISAASIIEKARYSFISEDFLNAFKIIEKSFDSISYSDILGLLRGELDLVDLQLVQGTNEDYQHDVKDILANHDFLITHKNKYYQITKSIPFDISNQFNDLSNYLKQNENKIIFEDAYFKVLSKMIKSTNYEEPAMIIYSNQQIYFLELFKNNIFQDISMIYEFPHLAVQAFDEYQNSI